MINFRKLSDKELYSLCKKWGAEVLEARRKFAGLLPEVWRRELAANEKGRSWLRRRGFTCLYEFAAKLAGMSREQVDQVVRIDKRFEDKPVLREALVSGAVSVNKLARVVSIATVENQGELLRKIEILSNRALEVFVKDYKNLNGFSEPISAQNSMHVQTQNATSWLKEGIVKTGDRQSGQTKPEKIVVFLDADIAKELLEMQSRNIDVNGPLRKFLQDMKEKHEQEKQEVAAKQEQERYNRAIIGFPAKRYIPAEVRKIVNEEFGDRCSALGCCNPAVNLHHEKGFMKDQCHDPRFLKPLCKGHHELAHFR